MVDDGKWLYTGRASPTAAAASMLLLVTGDRAHLTPIRGHPTSSKKKPRYDLILTYHYASGSAHIIILTYNPI